MALRGKKVADAFIEVHGDLSDFRNDLDKAKGDVAKLARQQADSFTEEWGKRMASGVNTQWAAVVDSMYSNDPIDVNRLIGDFNATGLDDAQEKVNKFLLDMSRHQKLIGNNYDKTKKALNEAIDGMREYEAEQARILKNEQDLTRAQEEALNENRAWGQRRRQTMEQAIADNERFNRSFKGMILAVKQGNLENDFRDIAKAIASADFSEFAKGFDTFDGLRGRINEVTDAMLRQNRITAEAAQLAKDGAQEYISAEEAKSRAAKKALEEAKALREEQERYNKSFEGMVAAAKKLDLEDRFKGISRAMATMDFSHLARGTENMEDLQRRTLATATEMRNLGRITDAEFGQIQDRLKNVAVDMSSYNVSFREAVKRGTEHRRDWTIIDTMIGNAGKKFAGFTGLNIITDMFREGAQFFQDLDRNAVKIGKMVLLIGSATSTILSAVGGLAVIGQDLAAIGNIGILAPGFLTAIGISVGVLIAAFKDMKEVLADLGPQFTALQDSISAKFWAEAEAPIRNMVDVLMPTLSAKLAETATMLGGLTGAFADALANVDTDDIATMFDRMNSAIGILGGAMDPLIQAFAALGMVGSEYFEGFAQWIVDISNQFNNFIQGAAADGRLNEWINRAIQGIKDVGSILASVVGIFNAIGDAAERAGIGGLSSFADALQKASTTMNSEGFQSVLTTLFDGAAAGAAAVGKAILALGPQLALVMPTFSGALATIGTTVATIIGYIGKVISNPTVMQGFSDFINGIKAGVDALAPAIGPLGDSLGQVGSLLGQIAAQLGPLIAAFITGLSPVLDQITEAFARITFAAGPEILKIIETLSPMLQNVIDILLPPLERLIMAVLPLIAPAFAALAPVIETVASVLGPVIDAIAQLIEMIAPYLVPAIEKIVAAVTPVLEIFGQVVAFILELLVPILGTLLIGIINNVVGAFEGLSRFIMGFVDVVSAIFKGFGEFFTKLFKGDFIGALESLGTMFKEIWDGIVKMLSGALEFLWNAVQLLFIGKLVGGIKSALTSIGGFFKSSWDDIVNFVKGALNNLNGTILNVLGKVGEFIKNMWQGAVNIVRGAWEGMVNLIRNALNTASSAVSGGLNAIANFFRTIWQAASSVVSNAWNGMINVIRNAISGISNSIWSGLSQVGNFIRSVFQSAVSSVQGAFSNMVSAVSGGVGNIMNWIRNLPSQIGNALSGLGYLLQNAGRVIMDGFLSGLRSAWGSVTSFVGGIADWIRNNKGPLPYDRQLLVPAGKAIMDGLGAGLESKLSMLKSVLDTVTSTMEDAVTEQFTKSKMYVAGADAVLGLADGLKSNKSAIDGALGALTPTLTGSNSLRVSASTAAGDTAGQRSGAYFAEGAVQVVTRASDAGLVASTVGDTLDAQFSDGSRI